VIDYVESEFKRRPELKEKYPTILDELNGLLEYPDYDSIKDYSKFLKDYFLGPKKAAETINETIDMTEPEAVPSDHNANNKIDKPWWKFW